MYADLAAADGRAQVVAVPTPIGPAVRSWLIGMQFPPRGGSTAGKRWSVDHGSPTWWSSPPRTASTTNRHLHC
jgi:hypothetical protein